MACLWVGPGKPLIRAGRLVFEANVNRVLVVITQGSEKHNNISFGIRMLHVSFTIIIIIQVIYIFI